jgi:hypothetical protein
MTFQEMFEQLKAAKVQQQPVVKPRGEVKKATDSVILKRLNERLENWRRENGSNNN